MLAAKPRRRMHTDGGLQTRPAERRVTRKRVEFGPGDQKCARKGG
jgi:hypothetical protein